MKFFSETIVECKNADIHLHYANNKGRGRDNVTLTIVESGQERKRTTKEYKSYINQYRVSGWHGNVNIPTCEIKKYGGLKIVR